MPLLDSYLLDNYLIDGPSSSNLQSLIIPAINANDVVAPGQTGLIREIMSFPAGTKLISIAPISPGTFGKIWCYQSTSNTNFNYNFALVDGNGVYWDLTTGSNTSSGLALFSLQISEAGSLSIYTSSNLNDRIDLANAKSAVSFNKPAAFNMNTLMRFGVGVYANNASTGNVTLVTAAQGYGMRTTYI